MINRLIEDAKLLNGSGQEKDTGFDELVDGEKTEYEVPGGFTVTFRPILADHKDFKNFPMMKGKICALSDSVFLPEVYRLSDFKVNGEILVPEEVPIWVIKVDEHNATLIGEENERESILLGRVPNSTVGLCFLGHEAGHFYDRLERKNDKRDMLLSNFDEKTNEIKQKIVGDLSFTPDDLVASSERRRKEATDLRGDFYLAIVHGYSSPKKDDVQGIRETLDNYLGVVAEDEDMANGEMVRRTRRLQKERATEGNKRILDAALNVTAHINQMGYKEETSARTRTFFADHFTSLSENECNLGLLQGVAQELVSGVKAKNDFIERRLNEKRQLAPTGDDIGKYLIAGLVKQQEHILTELESGNLEGWQERDRLGGEKVKQSFEAIPKRGDVIRFVNKAGRVRWFMVLDNYSTTLEGSGMLEVSGDADFKNKIILEKGEPKVGGTAFFAKGMDNLTVYRKDWTTDEREKARNDLKKVLEILYEKKQKAPRVV